MDPKLEELADSIKGMLKDRLKGYLSSEADKKEFLQERCKRLAELTLELGKAWNNEEERRRISAQMEVVKDTITNELHAVAISLSVEYRAAVRQTLETTLDFAMKVLPKILLVIAGL